MFAKKSPFHVHFGNANLLNFIQIISGVNVGDNPQVLTQQYLYMYFTFENLQSTLSCPSSLGIPLTI